VAQKQLLGGMSSNVISSQNRRQCLQADCSTLDYGQSITEITVRSWFG